jgi:3',5'-cyclic AMP phosphodiesterase CpdA
MKDFSLSIAHISDIHFGIGWEPLFGILGSTRFNRSVGQALKRDLIKQKPDVLIVSGDLTTTALDRQFKKSFLFINKLHNELKLKPNRVFVTPGNHDDSYRAFGAIPKPYLADRLRNFKFYFRKALNIPIKYIGPNGSDMYYPIPVNKPNILIFCLSSIYTMNLARGKITKDSMDWFTKIIDDYNDKKSYPLIITVIHHHPESIEDVTEDAASVLKNAGYFKGCLQNRQEVLVLHGHKHAYWIKGISHLKRGSLSPIHVVSAGTSTGRPLPAEKTNQYNLIKLTRTINKFWSVKVESRKYENNEFGQGPSDNFSIH